MKRELRPWRVVGSKITYEDRWIKLRSDHCVTAAGREVSPYHVIEYPDWINVVALTTDEQLVLVREYRHGRGEILTGLVSGVVEAKDGSGDQRFLNAAKRELLEETGYQSSAVIPILTAFPNAANLSNTVVSFLARDLVGAGDLSLDDAEAIEIIIEDFADLLRRVRSGALILQAMHVAALWSAAAYIAADTSSAFAGKKLKRDLANVLGGS